VLGLDEGGKLLLDAASRTEHFEVLAVADKDAANVERTSEKYGCQGYDDYRQLIQSRFDCLLVAEGLSNCEQYVQSAIKDGVNILKLAPAARNFDEAVELVRLAENHGIRFVVANPQRFDARFAEFRRRVNVSDTKRFFLVTAACFVADRRRARWQTDVKLAGGGVLLHDCYDIIDQIVWNFGIPQQVYSVNTSSAGDKQQRLYLAEDTAVVTMSFGDTFIGTLTVSRAYRGPAESRFIKVYGKEETVAVFSDDLKIRGGNGHTDEQLEAGESRITCMEKVLENFALSILQPDKNELSSSARENLSNMALIEACYLSARTGFPEQPARILQMARFEPTDVCASSH